MQYVVSTVITADIVFRNITDNRNFVNGKLFPKFESTLFRMYMYQLNVMIYTSSVCSNLSVDVVGAFFSTGICCLLL